MTPLLLFLNSAAEIEMLMNGVICTVRARKLQPFSITRGYCFLRKKTYEHFKTECYIWCCFCCRLRELLEDILIERNHPKYLFLINFK